MKLKLNDISNQTVSDIKIPQYTIERIERLPGSFQQGKLFVTIDESSNNESQHLLCDSLKKKFDEFSNIIICVYANNNIGKSLAGGQNKNASVENQKKYWLSMYTYNSVEGEYFDDNPGGFLGPF